MKITRIIASHAWLLAAFMAGAQVQTPPPAANQPTTMQSTAQPDDIGSKADKAQTKEIKRQDKHKKRAEKDRVNALKEQEKAAKSRAKADKQRDKSDVDDAKAATERQQSTPQP